MTEVEEELAALLQSDRLTLATRRALQERLAWTPPGPTVLSERQLAVLVAVADRLVPLHDLGHPLQLAARWEADLACGKGDGWRYAEMPSDVEALRLGLDALDASSFLSLDETGKDRLLARVQANEVADWPVRADRWFEEVLTNLVQRAYGHPVVQVSIGYDGMADAHGFQDVDG